jgi:phage terminase small subunit
MTMGPLTRRQHEEFAQLVSSGSTIVDAYEKSGYPRNRSNAHRLRRREHISARIDQLVAQRTAHAERETLNAAEKAGVDAYWVMRTLRRNCILAARRGDIAASNRAAELIGKHINMFIDRKQIDIAYADDADAYLAKIIAQVDGKVIDNELPLLESVADEPSTADDEAAKPGQGGPNDGSGGSRISQTIDAPRKSSQG